MSIGHPMPSARLMGLNAISLSPAYNDLSMLSVFITNDESEEYPLLGSYDYRVVIAGNTVAEGHVHGVQRDHFSRLLYIVASEIYSKYLTEVPTSEKKLLGEFIGTGEK